jgi:hypothetical protein
VISERVLNEAQARRLRADLEVRFEQPSVIGVARTKHHPVFAKGDRLAVAIGRNVPNGQYRHNHSMLGQNHA